MMRRGRSIAEILFGPHPRIARSEDRRGARLFASLTLIQAVIVGVVLVAITFIYRALESRSIWADQDTWVVVAGMAVIFVCYVLIRAGWFRIGAVLYIAVAALIPLSAPFMPDPNAEIGVLATAVIPIFLAAMIFELRWMIATLVAIVAVGAARLALSAMPAGKIATGYAVLIAVAVTGALVAIFRTHFARLERDRLGQIRQKEEALEESEARLRALLANSMDMILVMDADGRPRQVFGAFERILGYQAERILDASQPMGIAEADAPRIRELIARLATSPGAASAQWRQLHGDGSVRQLEAVASNCLEVPGIAGIVVNIRDVTERADAEAELQQASKMETVGRLAGGIAHDFNNMLTAVLGNASLVEQELDLHHPAQVSVAEIRKAARSAAGLTQRLLTFSRRQVTEPRPLSLNDVIGSMQPMLSRLLGETVRLQSTLAPDLCTVMIDPGLVEQILVNLAVNARDAMPDGGTLRVDTANVSMDAEAVLRHADLAPGTYASLAVADTGTGMSDEVKRHAFEPFYTTKPAGKGTGLGLATVYGAVRQSGGHIEVASVPGRGTVFTILLPMVSAQAQRLGRHELHEQLPGGTETILLVEDERQVRELAVRTLERLGYRVLAAESAEAALGIAAAHRGTVDLLFTDVVLPEMNGRQLAAAIIERHPRARVLFSSGYTRDIIARHGVLEEGIAFLAKPYTAIELARKVREALAPAAGGMIAAEPGPADP
jgi:PAS domain S-box-containing protein